MCFDWTYYNFPPAIFNPCTDWLTDFFKPYFIFPHRETVVGQLLVMMVLLQGFIVLSKDKILMSLPLFFIIIHHGRSLYGLGPIGWWHQEVAGDFPRSCTWLFAYNCLFALLFSFLFFPLTLTGRGRWSSTLSLVLLEVTQTLSFSPLPHHFSHMASLTPYPHNCS